MVHLDIILMLKLKGYPYVLLLAVWRSWDHVFIFFGSFLFPGPLPSQAESLTHRVPSWPLTQTATL